MRDTVSSLVYPTFSFRPTNPITGIRDNNIQLEGREGGEREREGGEMELEIIIYIFVFTLNIVLSSSTHKVSGAAGSEGGK